METVTISKTAVLAAHKKASGETKEVLETLMPDVLGNIMDRIKTFADVCADQGKDPELYAITPGMDEDEKGGIYFRKWALIVKCLNGGWQPNWANSNQPKYYTWEKFDRPSAPARFSYYDYGYDYSYTYLRSRLVFKSSELAIYASKQFNTEHNEFLLFN